MLALPTLGMLAPRTAFADSAPGVSDTEIKLGGVFPVTGPVRLVSEPYEQGIRAYFEVVNNRGGIHGRKINWLVEDDAYQPTRSLAAAKKLVERDGVFMLFGQFGTATANSMIPYLEQMQVPLMIVTAVPPPAKKYIFGFLANYAELSYQLTKFYIQERGAKRIGYFYQNDDLGESSRVGMERALKEFGQELAADVGFERGTSDFSTHALKLRDANVDHVLAMATAPSIAACIKSASSVGFKPIWGTYSIGSSAVMIKLLGDDIDGLVYGSELESQFSDTPGVIEHNEAVKALFPDANLEWGTLLGWAHAHLVVAALEQAGKDLTREGMLDALENAKDVEVGTMAPVSLAAGDNTSAARAIRIFQWENGKPQPKTDWIKMGAAS